MHDLSLTSRKGGAARVEGPRIEAFRAAVRGETFAPAEAGYEQARAVWNAMIDRRPALIVRCSGVADVLLGIDLARERDLVVSVRAGGHHIAGRSVCDGGLVLDLSRMRGVFDAMAPYATGGTYVNFMADDEDRARVAYGANYERLARLKKRYDPTNLFRMNQNVPPAA